MFPGFEAATAAPVPGLRSGGDGTAVPATTLSD